jgi:hypothetical protein
VPADERSRGRQPHGAPLRSRQARDEAHPTRRHRRHRHRRYDAGALFDVSSRPVSDIYSLNDVLTETSLNPRDFVIRGELKDGVDPRRCPRRLRERADRPPPTFREVPRWWLILDFDKADPPRFTDWRRGDVSAVALRRLLPPEFHGCSFWWSFSSSSGFKPGASRMKLGFWLSRPVTGAELGRWLASSPVDHAVFRPIQPIFIASPILRGVESPVPERTGLEQDFRDVVEVPDLREPAPPPPAERRAEQRQHLRTMTAHRFGWPYAVLEDNACASATPPAPTGWSGVNVSA